MDYRFKIDGKIKSEKKTTNKFKRNNNACLVRFEISHKLRDSNVLALYNEK